VGVYGLVAAIVKLDDAGLALDRSPRPAFRGLGQGILRLAPYLMKGLSIGGTAAMFLVGGGILAHALPALHHLAERAAATKGGVALLFDGMVGLLAGAAVVIVVTAAQRLRGNGRMHASG
jgi:predicted DNA repair protein MutK